MPIPSDDTHNSTSPGSREPPWLRGCRSDHASTAGVGPPLSPYLPSLGWRLLLIGLCATLAFLAVLAAGVALSPQALGPAGPMLRCVGLLPLVLLCVGIGAYLRWLRRSEARLQEDLAVALALSCGAGQEDAEDDRDPRRDAAVLEDAMQRLRLVAAAARVHHPHLAAQAVQRLIELAEAGDGEDDVALLASELADYQLVEGRRQISGLTVWNASPHG